MKVLVAAAALISVVSAADFSIYHRIFHPQLPAQPYTARGHVSLSDSSSPTFTPSPKLAEDLRSFTSVLTGLGNLDNALYQVALQPTPETPEALWDFSSTKLCYLNKVTTETIILSVSGAEPSPDSLDYFVRPIPRDGSCPLSKSNKKISLATSLNNFAKIIESVNTTVLLRGTETPIQPELKVPPPLNAEGEVVVPPPEKNFIQKYWMYILAVLMVILVTGGGEEEVPKRS
ncbi:hypothetical protein D9619_000815 [Psilocybe cf. subviscida]|uniref:ER membrane protein complex subunit 10 n=1 Tax=Psilocybe cf. subviscida TaxID=2480587 RepID=A0A8H5BF05_9AGAR|nr:hypothetical protein D9619_000815 [Psilocybe cf. subviscida]